MCESCTCGENPRPVRSNRAAGNRSPKAGSVPGWAAESAHKNERVAAVHGTGADRRMMCFVFRARRRVKGNLRVSRMFTGQFRLAGDIKPMRVPLCVTDKQVAEKKLRGIVREAEREREGLSLPKEQRDAAKQSVESYVQEFVESRRGLKRDEKYVRELERKLLRLTGECEWSTLRDVTPHSFEAWRARQSGLSAKTLNEYRATIFGLCGWLESRVGTNAIRSVRKVAMSDDPKRKRRAFTPEELRRLIDVSGERGIVYLVAASTGIRRGELARIEWRDVHIDGPRPYITVRASIAKNAKLAHQPLPPSVAAALRQRRLVDVAPSDLVF